MRISVDIGFGFVKVLNDKGEKECFPSVIARRSESTLKSIIGGSVDDYAITYWESENGSNENERKVYVGDAAMTNNGERNWDNKGKFNLDDLKIFISTAIGLVNHLNEKVELCVGLPMSYYVDMKDNLKEVLQSINAVVDFGKSRVHIQISSVFVFPQGAGAYYAAIYDVNGDIKDYELAGSSVGLIDVGYRTVDYLVMGKGRKGITMIENLYGSLEEDGMNVAYQDVQSAISEDRLVQEEISIIEIEKALLWFGGQLGYKSRNIDISTYEEKAYKDRADQISSKIKLKWGSEVNLLSKVFITGGGGQALYPYLKDKFEQSELQSNPNYANCEGYLGAQARKMLKLQASK